MPNLDLGHCFLVPVFFVHREMQEELSRQRHSLNEKQTFKIIHF
jgi:hypothetical protein